jgi:hypothetical protein
METEIRKNQPGGTVDSWCAACQLVLAHTIEGMVGNRPTRVQCNTCKAKHAYKRSEPVKASRQLHQGEPGNSSRPVRSPANRYKTLLKRSETADAKKYTPKDRYETGDVLEHASFGRGIATAVKGGTKIEVLFESGSKLLIQGCS